MKPSLLVLAAGMGSRYGGLKQLESMGPNGETIMDYSVYDAIEAGFGKVVFVVRSFFRKEFEQKIIERYGASISIGFAEQEPDILPGNFVAENTRSKPWGTGHAVLAAKEQINTPFAVINADDYYGKNSYKIIAEHLKTLKSKKGVFAMVGFQAGNTLSESGTVSRGVCTTDIDNCLTSVEEHHNIKKEGGTIFGTNGTGDRVIISSSAYVSMNMWGFTPDIFEKGEELFLAFLKSNINEEKAEFYIPFMVNTLLGSGYARCRVLSTPDQWFGVTYKEDKAIVAKKINEMCSRGFYPSPLFQ